MMLKKLILTALMLSTLITHVHAMKRRNPGYGEPDPKVARSEQPLDSKVETGTPKDEQAETISIYEIIAQKTVAEITRSRSRLFTYNPDEVLAKFISMYKEFEGNLDDIASIPAISMWGGINYIMTLDKMKETVKDVFGSMKNDGIIISKDDFELIKDHYYTEKQHTDLSRIWGASYLKEKINASEELRQKYDVPKYIIVADNPNKIMVDISFGIDKFPVVSSLENATFYFQNIIGTKAASWGCAAVKDLGRESGIGFDDFSGAGNIIRQDGTGKNYIVDTELKSFHIPIPLFVEERTYLHERFKYLNSIAENSYAYEFDLP